MPAQSISFIYQVQGCQHVLVQPGSDTEAPTIPALTTKGFVRWQSIQILLEPQTHAPIMQFAVKHWSLKNPDDGTLFPADLPKEAFPLETDADTDKWHQECAVRLREQATPKEEQKPNFSEPRDGRPDPKGSQKGSFDERKVPFAHVRVDPSQRDYFSPRGVNYVRPDQGIPRGVPMTRSPERDKHHDRDRDRDWVRDRDRPRPLRTPAHFLVRRASPPPPKSRPFPFPTRDTLGSSPAPRSGASPSPKAA
jgi:hypothetical protein